MMICMAHRERRSDTGRSLRDTLTSARRDKRSFLCICTNVGYWVRGKRERPIPHRPKALLIGHFDGLHKSQML